MYMKRLLHCVLISSVVWLVIFYGNYLQFITKDEVWSWPIFLLSALYLGVCGHLVLHQCVDLMRDLTIVTNISMMTDRRLLRKTVNQQREETSEAFVRLYRLLRQVRRELIRREKWSDDRPTQDVYQNWLEHNK